MHQSKQAKKMSQPVSAMNPGLTTPAVPTDAIRATSSAPIPPDPVGAQQLMNQAAGKAVDDPVVRSLAKIIEDEKPDQETLEVMERAVQDIAPRRRSAILTDQLRDAQAFRAGASDPDAPEAKVIEKLVDAENRQLLEYSKLTARARDKWSRGGSMHLFPPHRGDTQYLSRPELEEYAVTNQYTVIALSVKTSWVSYLRAYRHLVPCPDFDWRLFNSILYTSHRKDIVAVVQETLESAGYAFTNVVPTWSDHTVTNTLEYKYVYQQAQELMRCLRNEVEAWFHGVNAARTADQRQPAPAASPIDYPMFTPMRTPAPTRGNAAVYSTPPPTVARGLDFTDVSPSTADFEPRRAKVVYGKKSAKSAKSNNVAKAARQTPVNHDSKPTPATAKGTQPRPRQQPTRQHRRAPSEESFEESEYPSDSDYSGESDEGSSDSDVAESVRSERSARSLRKVAKGSAYRARGYGRVHEEPAAIVTRSVAADAIEIFNPRNRWDLDERRAWWEKYDFIATDAGWPDRMKCKNLRRLLVKPARAWYSLLSKAVRRSWEKLSEAFIEEFCIPSESPGDAYFKMSHTDSTISVRQYLWVFNRAAKRAGVPFREGFAMKEHLQRFVRGLKDPAPYQFLVIGKQLRNIDEVEEALKAMEKYPTTRGRQDSRNRDRDRDHSRDRSRESSRERGYAKERESGGDRDWDRRPRDRDREAVRDRDRDGGRSGDRDRDRDSGRDRDNRDRDPSQERDRDFDGRRDRRSESRTYRADYDRQDERRVRFYDERGEDDYGYDESDSEDVYQAVSNGASNPPQQQRQYQGNQQQSQGGYPPRPFRRDQGGFPPSPRANLTCTECGASGHVAATCWSKIQCTDCGRMGHLPGRCLVSCGVCDKRHPRGRCEVRTMLTDVQHAVKDMAASVASMVKHAGLKAAEVSKSAELPTSSN